MAYKKAFFMNEFLLLAVIMIYVAILYSPGINPGITSAS